MEMLCHYLFSAFHDLLFMFTFQFDAATDRETLLMLKDNSLFVRDGMTFYKWGTLDPMGIWQGVRINDEGRVRGLFICPGFLLTGIISPVLGNLTALITLHLTDNGLTGCIPAEVILSSLSSLVLALLSCL